MPTVDRGLVATDDPLAADLAVSMDSQVGQLDKDTTQLTSILMSRLPVATASSFKEECKAALVKLSYLLESPRIPHYSF